jgi:hypothetical protein
MGIPFKASVFGVATDEINLKDASVCEDLDLTKRLTISQRVWGAVAPSPGGGDEDE